MSRRGLAGLIVPALLAACASPFPSPPPAVSASALARTESAAAAGYLTDAELARLAAAVPPAPAADSPTAQADRARSDAYRALEGSERWLLATAHAEIRPPVALAHFDCALGTRLGGAETPSLARLAARLFHDADAVAERVKARAHRPRPVGDDPARQPCQRVTEAGRASASYPSGTAAIATAYAETLAALAPDRAEAVRAIGHEIGRSRVICAMHYPSDVAAGEAAGRAVADALAGHPAYEADLAAARAELAAARAAGLTNPGCAAERSALARPLP